MNFIRDSINVFFTRIFVYIIMIGISIYIARVLGPEAKGIYSLLTQFVFISVLLMKLGIDNAAVFFLGKREDISKIYPNIISLTIISSLIIVLSLTLSLDFLSNTLLKNVELILILIALFSIPFKMSTEMSSSVILGMNKIKLLNSLRIIHFLLLLITFAVFVILFKLNLKGAIFGFVFTEVVMTFIYLFIISSWSKICLRFEPAMVKKLLNYGLRGFLGQLFLLLIFRLDFFLLNYFKDTKSVGFYSIAVSFGELLSFIPEVIGMLLFPKLLSSDAGTVDENTIRVLRPLLILLVILTALLFGFVSWIVPLIYGEQYAHSIPLIRILLPGFLMMSFYYIFFSYFFSKGKPEVVTFVLSSTMAFKALLAIILVPLRGAEGAAISSTIAYTFCGLTFIIIFLKYSRVTILDALLVKSSDIKYLYKYLVI